MRHLILIGLLVFSLNLSLQAQENYKATGVSTNFFSSAPIEDIEAHSQSGISLWNTQFATLKGNNAITVTSTSNSGHTHSVNVRCATA